MMNFLLSVAQSVINNQLFSTVLLQFITFRRPQKSGVHLKLQFFCKPMVYRVV